MYEIGVVLWAILVMSLIALLSSLKNSYNKNSKQRQLERLNYEVEQTKKDLVYYKNELNNAQKGFRLNQPSQEILDKYQLSNIRVPMDIIEELAHMDMKDAQNIVDYIENQRIMWKAENGKKLFKNLLK